MELIHIVSFLEKALLHPLPGTDVQWEMASSDRRMLDYPRVKRDDSRLAAVMILLYPKDGKVMCLFMQRPQYDGVHSGQISFPGGKMEDSDKNLTQTAVRETCEETGVCGKDISIIGKLTALFIPVSNIEVSPVVAYMNSEPVFTPNDEEVVSLIEAPLEFFLDPSIIKEKPMLVRDEQLNVKYYDFEGSVIWGATAMILNELLVILKGLE
ncbi:MAG: CoA pyrophosphatase [Bacteroidales bacterium]|nr:CoA pyrophosphatase [Bacteroidales bacterium]